MNQPMMSPKAAQSYIPHLGRVIDECSLHLAANGHDMANYLPRVTFEMSVYFASLGCIFSILSTSVI